MGAGDPGALKGAIDRCKNELQRDPDNEALAAVLKGMNDFAAYYAAESRFLTRIKETYEEALRKYVTLSNGITLTSNGLLAPTHSDSALTLCIFALW